MRPTIRNPKLDARTAFTLLEMLTTVAVLVIVLGLMVSLARHVRERAAVALTKDLIRRLDALMDRYTDRHEGRMPEVASFPPRPPEPGPEAPAVPTTREAGARTAPGGAAPGGAGPRAGPQPPAAVDPSRPEAFDRRALSE